MPPRLTGWDYRTRGLYFVTACVSGRRPLFGDVRGGDMQLSPLGQLANRQLSIASGTILTPGSHVVMPDHVHVLLALGDPGGPLMDLATVVRRFKGNVTREARRQALIAISDQLWQRGFFDRVVRSPQELEALRGYIATNPLRWTLKRAKDQ